MKDIMHDISRLKSEYETKEKKIRKKYQKYPEKIKHELEKVNDEIFSYERFRSVIPESVIVEKSAKMTTSMIYGELQLHSLVNSMINILKPKDHKVYKEYHGRCLFCAEETLAYVPMSKYNIIYDFVIQQNIMQQKDGPIEVLCKKCEINTIPTKTRDIFILNEPNMRVEQISARIKSSGRNIIKFIDCIFGAQKTIGDVYAFRGVCEDESTCRELIEMARKMHTGASEHFIIKGDFFKNPEERKRTLLIYGKDGKTEEITRTHYFKDAIHVDMVYNNVGLEFQAWTKDMNERDKVREDAFEHVHYEEWMETLRRSNWPPGAYKLEKFIAETGIFGNYNPDFYRRMPQQK
jgi:hypothetical protein